jgi:hypothetical protein
MAILKALWSRFFRSERSERLARIDENLTRIVRILSVKL